MASSLREEFLVVRTDAEVAGVRRSSVVGPADDKRLLLEELVDACCSVASVEAFWTEATGVCRIDLFADFLLLFCTEGVT